MATTSLKPQKDVRGYSPLRELAKNALRDYGNTSAGRGDGEQFLFMIDAANVVLESVMTHPYWEGGVVSYYKSLDETKPVPDLIIQTGLTAWYAAQQDSKRAQALSRTHSAMMSLILYRLKFGTGRVVHQKEIFDKDDQGYVMAGDRSTAAADEEV